MQWGTQYDGDRPLHAAECRVGGLQGHWLGGTCCLCHQGVPQGAQVPTGQLLRWDPEQMLPPLVLHSTQWLCCQLYFPTWERSRTPEYGIWATPAEEAKSQARRASREGIPIPLSLPIKNQEGSCSPRQRSLLQKGGDEREGDLKQGSTSKSGASRSGFAVSQHRSPSLMPHLPAPAPL